MTSSLFLEQARAIVGEQRVLTDAHDTDIYQRDWRGRYKGSALAVILPASQSEVVAIVKLCNQFDFAIVPQGGNTGLVGGAVAKETSRPTILLNVSRLNRVIEIDTQNNSMTVEAGCILANVRTIAEENKRLFPMLLGSVGSCEIGGLVSTNAGGTGVLRWGNMRELVLGLEVVLADGTVWNGLRALRKDNTGYDLKQLFIGAEGTLGIITSVVLKLFPRVDNTATAMVALGGVSEAVDLLRMMQSTLGNRIEAFEIMSRSQIEIVLAHGNGLTAPMSMDSLWYVLIEIADSDKDWDASGQLEAVLGQAMEQELVSDAVIATDQGKANRIWDLRHHVSECNKKAGFTVSNDTSVPISKLPEFIDKVTARIAAEIPAATLCHVGHMGDGNIHEVVVLSRAAYPTPEACEDVAARVNLLVHEESVALNGSISAEHGIGKMHVERLVRFKPALDLQLMQGIKSVFDPKRLMNPGTIFVGA
jgi:FAD/FMN-containing dehydrogenase